MTMAVRIKAWGRLLATASVACSDPSAINGGGAIVGLPAAKITRLTALLAKTRPKMKRTRFRPSIKNTLPATMTPANMARTISISTLLQLENQG